MAHDTQIAWQTKINNSITVSLQSEGDIRRGKRIATSWSRWLSCVCLREGRIAEILCPASVVTVVELDDCQLVHDSLGKCVA